MPFLELKLPGSNNVEMIEWTPYEKPKPKFRFNRVNKQLAATQKPYSIDDEAVAILTEYYALKGLKPSAQEIADCRGVDAATQAEHETQMAAPPAPIKHVYGTPEFWKDWWSKKKAKEAKEAQAAQALLAKAQAEFAALKLKEV